MNKRLVLIDHRNRVLFTMNRTSAREDGFVLNLPSYNLTMEEYGKVFLTTLKSNYGVTIDFDHVPLEPNQKARNIVAKRDGFAVFPVLSADNALALSDYVWVDRKGLLAMREAKLAMYMSHVDINDQLLEILG